jgi:integrase
MFRCGHVPAKRGPGVQVRLARRPLDKDDPEPPPERRCAYCEGSLEGKRLQDRAEGGARRLESHSGAERPKLPRRRWRILEPVEVSRVARAFTDKQSRVVFLTLVLTGVRRSELQALRWRDVDLVEGVLRVRDSKSEDGIRSIALSRTVQEELWQHRRRSSFQGEDERVCHPERASIYRAVMFETALRGRSQGRGRRGEGQSLP